MAFEWNTGDDVSTGGSFLDQPGSYHLAITAVDETVTKKDGSLVDNAAFRIHCEVLNGTVKGQEKKTKDVVFFHPRPDQKNAGEFARKKIDRLFLATNLLQMDAIGGKQVAIDLQHMVGQQFVAKFQMDDDNKYVELAFADIFHVDDPAVKEVPKDAAMLGFIPAEHRWAGGKPPGEQAKPAGNGKVGASEAASTASTASDKPQQTVDVDNLDI